VLRFAIGPNLVSLSLPLEQWLKSRDLVLRPVIGPNLVSLSVPLEPWLESRDLVLRSVIGPNLVSLSVPLEPWLESRDLVLRSVARPTRSSPTAGRTFKGTGSPDGLRYFLYVRTDVGINKRRWCFEFLKCLQGLSIEINIFLPVNANTSWLIMLVA
jgi:hypothetical protein